MRTPIVLLALLVALAPAEANAWFFFFLPGSVTGAVTDKLTGAEGDNCVGPYAQVGDRITVPGKGTGTIRSLSGTSIRCTTNAYPIRALIDFTALPTPAGTPASPDTSFELHQCVYSSSKVGDGQYDSGAGNGVITAVSGPSATCPAGTPYRATVRFAGTGPLSAKEQPVTNSNPVVAPPRATPDTEHALTPAEPLKASAGKEGGERKASPIKSELGFAHRGDPLGSTSPSGQSAVAPPTPSQSPVEAAPPAPTTVPTAIEPGRDGITVKLRSLQSMLKEGLITQEDYDSKKGDLLKQL